MGDPQYFKDLSKNYHKHKKYIFELLHEDLKEEKYTNRQLSRIYGIDESTVSRHRVAVGAKSPRVDKNLNLYEHVYRRLANKLHRKLGFASGERFYSVDELCKAEDVNKYTSVKVIAQLILDGYIYKASDNRNYVT